MTVGDTVWPGVLELDRVREGVCETVLDGVALKDSDGDEDAVGVGLREKEGLGEEEGVGEVLLEGLEEHGRRSPHTRA